MQCVVLIVVVRALLTGCDTIAGGGKDIKASGSKIEKAAEKAPLAPWAP